MSEEQRSVAFDRAAEYYDSTRAVDSDALDATIELLAAELAGRGPCLDVGVGTGIVALPLSRAGVSLVGIDLSRPMLDKLVAKAGDRPPFPTALADATRLPFGDGVYGGGIVRWVLHLIAGWRRAVDELCRVVGPGGTVLVNMGDFRQAYEIIDQFCAAAGGLPFAVGLDPRDVDALDGAFARHGASLRVLPPIRSRYAKTVGEFLDEMEAGAHSWTWRVPEDVRLRLMPEIRAWTTERFGSLDAPLERDFRAGWRAYDLEG